MSSTERFDRGDPVAVDKTTVTSSPRLGERGDGRRNLCFGDACREGFGKPNGGTAGAAAASQTGHD